MAARHLQRISSVFLRNQTINRKPMPIFQSTRIIDQFCSDKRAIQTKSEPADTKKVAVEVEEVQNNSIKAIDVNQSTSLKYSVTSSMKTSARHDLAMVFTCKVCETRSVKTATRESYDKGVVVAHCDGCNNYHLIADRLGFFGEPGSIEEFLAARGEEVKKGSPDTINLTLDDLAGIRKPQ
ncbi:hypothetical protein C5167_001135 [Papaver somniferum]|uniref:DNL-type domain-containing protein n=1 Tax=Papaver somniferum TaxID=3469 RepID=A0A4Y7KUG1_PAPSO|nr:DNL-type zinc finger protein [Papaver somniferum]RZC76973.1 hypothetical protein C5167_001135 [Papaver somniferum]